MEASTTLEESPPAVSERGVQIRHSEREVDLALEVLILCGGRQKQAAAILREQGLTIKRDTLRDWRNRQFPRRFAELRHRLAPDVSEDMAGRALERAQQANDATEKYIKAAVRKLDEVDANHLAKNAKALADVATQNVGTAQLLRDRPTAITRDRSVEELFGVLERLKVLEVDDDDVIDCETVD